MTCNICQGGRTVRLPTFELATAVNDVEVPTLNPGFEEFPCPKCGPLRVKVERIGAIKGMATLREDSRKLPDYVDHLRSSIAAQIGIGLLTNGWIDFEEQYDRQSGNTLLRATAYVAHPTVGRGAIEQQQPKPVTVVRQATEINDVKITIVFDPDVGTGRMATIQTEQPNGETRRFKAKVVDCSLRMQEPESYVAVNSPFQRRVFTGPRGFDLNVDLRCDGIDIGDRTSPDVETPSEPVPPRDPFAREIDFE